MLSSNNLSSDKLNSEKVQPQTVSRKPKILALSLDFDGCIFNRAYTKSHSKNRLIKKNEELLKHLEQIIQDGNYDKVIFMVGSNRQSWKIDQYNDDNTGSCFPALRNLCKEIQKRTGKECITDEYLLSDTYSKKPLGENFRRALGTEPYKNAEFVWDPQKYSILYTQMHKIAHDNQNADIDFQFYDDHVSHILNKLANFYYKNKMLVPENVNLSLHQYVGTKPTNIQFADGRTILKGRGIIDEQFQENLKVLCRTCEIDPEQAKTNIGQNLSIPLIYEKYARSFVFNRILSPQNLQLELRLLTEQLQERADMQPIIGYLNAVKTLADEIGKEFSKRAASGTSERLITMSRDFKLAKSAIELLLLFIHKDPAESMYVDEVFVKSFGQFHEMLSTFGCNSNKLPTLFTNYSDFGSSISKVIAELNALLDTTNFFQKSIRDDVTHYLQRPVFRLTSPQMASNM